MLYIIIGIAGLALLLYLLTVHRSPATTTFAVVVAIIVAGLIFDPEDKQVVLKLLLLNILALKRLIISQIYLFQEQRIV